ncbi:MAG: hypothetical protein AAF215_14575 [Cyanobacteria bacterium P01_A01_bin.123]
MNFGDGLSPWKVHKDLQVIAASVHQAADRRQEDVLDLLALLRMLEGLHREIRETLFRDALPENRQKLYMLLKDIEVNGGWPYIQRMKLRSLLQALESQEAEDGQIP